MTLQNGDRAVGGSAHTPTAADTHPNLDSMAKMVLPSYHDLPRVPNTPYGCTWGLWDSTHRDQLGTLNLLTPERRLEASKEVESGISVAINWSMDNCQVPQSNRKSPCHRIIELTDFIAHDDEIEINTQGGSQWDGFRMYLFV